MKIGVDATCWGNKRGFGRFTRELLEAILEIDQTNEYIFFINADTEDGDSIPAKVEKIVVETEVSAIKAASSEGRRSLKDLWAMSRAVFRHKTDVFFFPAVYSYFPILNRTKILLTIHDVIADHHPKLVFPNKKLHLFWRLKQNAAIRQADLILTVSEYSKQQIGEFFNLPESRLRVINEAARPIFRCLELDDEIEQMLARYGLKRGETFLLYVGGISPHKNLNTLITAFEEVSRNQTDVKLVLIGDYKDDPFLSAYPSLKKQIADSNLESKVIFTGFVSDEDLVRFYNACTLLVFPSLEEGFGLPAMEAMACGTAVAASNCGSLPEVLGNAGVYFDPRDSTNIARTIEEILSDDARRNSMKEIGFFRAEQFQWVKAAEDTLKIFNELAGQPSKIKFTSPEVIIDSKRL
jgi:glycosyltransferase involved in cell wall biosynthesis